MPTGYRSGEYAASLEEFGTPLRLPRSGGHLLVRAIPGAPAELDAAAPYPLFCCDDWSELAADLESLPDGLVSVTLVTDPFGDWTVPGLNEAFPDRRTPFKDHFVVELAADPLRHVSRHHRRCIARGRRHVAVEMLSDPRSRLEDWNRMYAELVARHAITGISAFSPDSFEHQFGVPGLVAFEARSAGETVGMALWFVDRGVAYWHLASYSGQGYRLDASYALLAEALEHFTAQSLRWAALGAGAGLHAGADDGLSRFKAGWATQTRSTHLCGRILDRERYAALGGTADAFFPAYRGGKIPA